MKVISVGPKQFSDPGANNQTGRIWRDQTAAGDGSHQHCESSIGPPDSTCVRVYSECLISWDGVVHEFMGWTKNLSNMLWQVWFNQGWVSLCISNTDYQNKFFCFHEWLSNVFRTMLLPWASTQLAFLWDRLNVAWNSGYKMPANGLHHSHEKIVASIMVSSVEPIYIYII